jgi:hypothetical protein
MPEQRQWVQDEIGGADVSGNLVIILFSPYTLYACPNFPSMAIRLALPYFSCCFSFLLRGVTFPYVCLSDMPTTAPNSTGVFCLPVTMGLCD